MLLDLNDDCLEYICEFLDIPEQIAMKNVCQRLDGIIHYLWQRKAKKTEIKKHENDYFKKEKNEYLHFITAISNVVEDLNLGLIESDRFHLLVHLKFPKVAALSYEIFVKYNCPDVYNYDYDMLQVNLMFPHLTKFSIKSRISGKYITNMRQLTELHLRNCDWIDVGHLTDILSNLKLRKFTILYDINIAEYTRIQPIALCETLEELQISDYNLIMVIEDFLKMPNLKSITIDYTLDHDVYELNQTSDVWGRRMHTMIYHDVFWFKDKHAEDLQKMLHLKKLIFFNDYVNEDKLYQIAGKLRKLQEFRCIKVRSDNEESLLRILENNRKLEIYDISHMKVSTAFLHNVIAIIERQQRIVPLQFYCFDTVITETSYKNLTLPRGLCINTSKQKLHLPKWRSLQFTWHPENAGC